MDNEELLTRIEKAIDEKELRNTHILLMMDAKVQAMSEIVVELADIVTQKDPGQVAKEFALKTVEAFRKSKRTFETLRDFISEP